MPTNSRYDGTVKESVPNGPWDPLIQHGNYSAMHTNTTKPQNMAEAQADRAMTNPAVFFP